jgi:D-alanyl-lipoteichoic acid acyltransferase DltB (MBOAT superfamily)
MSFTSLKYLFFLPLLYILFQVVPDRYRWLLLLLASYGFYAAMRVPYLVGVLLLVTLLTYVVGLLLGATSDPTRRRLFLWAGVVGNLLILVLLKYLPFLDENLASLFLWIGFDHISHQSTFFTTIGVSYFVFQAVSYLVDLNLEIIEPERHAGRFALYMAFFPKLLQGPIERGGDLLPQLRSSYRFDYEQARTGLIMFTWGLFKKVVIADGLAGYVNLVYDNVYEYSGLPLLLTTYIYALQIYFDFSGYTDMALGSARLFNIQLTQNFNSPYLATSMADFWRRWHISFSRWILDYIFKPLQMKWRGWGTTGSAVALIITFLISGLWHGASWGFVVWGGLHGTFLAFSVYWKPYQKRIHNFLGIEKTRILRVWQTVVTFHLICVGWIFFRANTIGDAWYILKNVGIGPGDVLIGNLFESWRSVIVQLLLLSLPLIVCLSKSRGVEVHNFKPYFRWSCYYALIFIILIFDKSYSSGFLYFQF